jgi:hypothetical protein
MSFLVKIFFQRARATAVFAASAILIAVHASAQPVVVSMVLDTNKVSIGQTTVLHVYGEIAPEEKPATTQIFSWYLDFLNPDGSIASANYAGLLRPASDNDPRISSDGVTEGANRHGIYDTFLNFPGAGHDGPVELFSVPVTGLVAGQVTFTVAPGTGVQNLTSDFLVAPEGGGDPLFGGDYSGAAADLEVISTGPVAVTLQISLVSGTGGEPEVKISFPTQTNVDQFVEFSTVLGPAANWQTLPGAPHNLGSVIDSISDVKRYYRLRLVAR